MRRPVVRLRLALYGHPDSGTYWERHCDTHLRSVGFQPVSEVWNSCYFHKQLKLYLVVYVDDFKLSGPKDSLAKGWALIRKGLQMEDPTPLGVFLGCAHKIEKVPIGTGQMAAIIGYDMSEFMANCVRKYLDLAPGARLRPADTPFLPEDHALSPQGAPKTDGPVSECPWCLHTFPPPKIWKSAKELESSIRDRRKQFLEDIKVTKEADQNNRGRLASVAANIVMKILHGARFARMDMLRIIGYAERLNATRGSTGLCVTSIPP